MNIIENFNDGLIKGLEKKLDVTKKAIDSSIDQTASNLQNSLTSVLGPDGKPGMFDPLYNIMFRFLIKPFNKKARLQQKDKGIFKIIGMSIMLLIMTTYNFIVGNTLSANNYIIDKTVTPVISTTEKVIGYRSDGRRIGPERKPSEKIPLLIKILKTILKTIAGLLDIILMAFTNQVDVFTTIVRDLLGK